MGHTTVWKSLQCALTTVATAEIDVKTVYSKLLLLSIMIIQNIVTSHEKQTAPNFDFFPCLDFFSC